MKKIILPLLFLSIGLVLVIVSFFVSPQSKGDLDVEIDKASFIMPAAHHVYANKDALNGKYYLFKAKITNNTSQKLYNVNVRYRVPGYIDWTPLSGLGEMISGQTASVVCYPKFGESITEKMTESMEKAEIQISWDGGEEKMVEEEFSFRIVNRNDFIFTGLPPDEISTWGDVHDNDALLACFVTPNDPIVKYYTQIVQEKILKGESASVTKDPKDAVRFLMGIYEATILSHMVYSGTKGIPQSLEDVSSFSQHNRLPREVITGNTGLCLELSLLYSSMLSAAGIDPIIFLIPGHAYPGFRMNNQFYALEATGIGGEGLGSIASAEEAFKAGQKQLEEFLQHAQNGDPRYTLVDVHALNQQGVTSMALKDDEFLRQKVDKIAENFAPSLNENNSEVAKHYPSSNPSNNNVAVTNASIRSTGPLSFNIPAGWETIHHPMPNVPIVSSVVISPDQVASIAVYDVPAGNYNEAMQIISQYLNALGSQVQYNINGNILVGQTNSQNGTWVWKGKALQTNAGVRIVTVGSYQMTYAQKEPIINNIFNSIQ